MTDAVYQTELTLLPDPVVKLIARLECALRETDFKQVRLDMDIAGQQLPVVHVIVDLPDAEVAEKGKEV